MNPPDVGQELTPTLQTRRGHRLAARSFIPRNWIKNGWTRLHLIMLVVMAAVGFLATLDAWLDILRIAWKDEESSHIFLVPIVSAWLIWVRRGRFRRCRPRGEWIGWVLIGAGWTSFSLGDTYLVQILWHGGALLVVLGSIFSVLGTDVFFAFLSIILLQLFVLPVPGRIRQSIAIPLENVTTAITQNACEFLGILSDRSANVLTINGHPVRIEEACNGLRMVFALTLVSFAFAFGTPLRGYVRALVLVASPLCAIFCNVIRLVPTVWMYGYWPESLADQFHSISGWIMLPIAFLLLLGIIRILRWALVPVTIFTLAYD
jgi:exosortase